MSSEEEKEEKINRNRRKLIENGKQLLNTIYEEESDDDVELKKGETYLVKEKKPERGLKVSLQRMKKEERGYVLTRMSPKKIKNRFSPPEDKLQIYWLTKLKGENNFDPSDLPLIAHSIIDFLEKERGTIFIEGVETLLKHNSFDRFLSFIDNIVDVVEVENGILVVSLDPKTISERCLAQMERKLEIIS